MEKQKFDALWKEAFDHAGVDPGENVWTNIALDLERARGERLRKRLIFYQVLAAASIVLTAGIGIGLFYFNQNEITDKTVAIRQFSPGAETTKPGMAALPRQQKAKTADKRQNGESTGIEKNLKRAHNGPGNGPDDFRVMTETASVVSHSKNDAPRFHSFPERSLPILVENEPASLHAIETREPEADPVALMLARLDQREREMKEEASHKDDEDGNKENLWTSVGFAAGSFSTTNAGVSPSSAMSLSTLADEEVTAPGITYSMGVNLGTKISEKWVVQGGVNYLTQSSDFTAHNVVTANNFTKFRPPSLNELKQVEMTAENKLVTTVPYNVNNNIRYLSIPVQAGYLLVNRDFGLQLSAGVSTDLFLQNTVTAEGDNLDKTGQKMGEDSPYRPVNLSGLVGTELSYRFADHYRISLNPGIRYPFNSIYKSDLDVKASPLTFDIGLRFRYIFH